MITVKSLIYLRFIELKRTKENDNNVFGLVGLFFGE